MGIKFVPKGKVLRLLDIRPYEKTYEDGSKKLMHFGKFVDEGTFESNEFLLPKEIDSASLTVQTRYEVELDVEGKWSRLTLTPATDSKPGGFPATK